MLIRHRLKQPQYPLKPLWQANTPKYNYYIIVTIERFIKTLLLFSSMTHIEYLIARHEKKISTKDKPEGMKDEDVPVPKAPGDEIDREKV